MRPAEETSLSEKNRRHDIEQSRRGGRAAADADVEGDVGVKAIKVDGQCGSSRVVQNQLDSVAVKKGATFTYTEPE